VEQAGAARHALEAKLAEAKAVAGGAAKEKEEELAALRARVAAADAAAQERFGADAVHVEAARPCLPHRRARPHGVLYRHATQRRLILLLLAPIRDHTAPQRL
jgi:hypothetical protein